MKKGIALLIAVLGLVAFAEPAFLSAQPVWPANRAAVMNDFVGFRAAFDVKAGEQPILRVTGSTVYRIWLNGRHVGYGPARAAKGFFRVDEWPLAAAVRAGKNELAIEVSAYNCNTYSHCEWPGFLQAEVVLGKKVIACTRSAAEGAGAAFSAYNLSRITKASRYSFQRAFAEAYSLTPTYEAWKAGKGTALPLAMVPAVPLVARIAPLPDFTVQRALKPLATTTVHRKEKITYWGDRCIENINAQFKGYRPNELEAHVWRELQHLDIAPRVPCVGPAPKSWSLGESGVLFDVGFEETGFPGATVQCTKACRLWFTFDEILQNGKVNPLRYSVSNGIYWDLEPGTYALEAFEPYSFRYLHVGVVGGAATVTAPFVRGFKNPDAKRASFRSSDPALDKIFVAARETFAQNAVDVFTDCPSRERAGWLCDSFFTARSSVLFTGRTDLERLFLQNYLLPKTFDGIPEGMLPMCYPADHPNGNFIPNWSMWFVLELDEYLARGGDRATVDALKPRLVKLINYLKTFRNADGLLERLPAWVFVEWSRANHLTQHVNYPSNMTWAEVLDCMDRLYGMPELAAEAQKVRATVRQQSWNGTWFCDNAVRQKDGTLKLSGECTETCQYYAFMFKTATPETHPTLWKTLLEDFGPSRFSADRKTLRKHPQIWPSNAFIGNYLRLELLSRAGLDQKVLDETKGYLTYMADRTGTLWENDTPAASCNHGFASHAAVFYVRNVLGVEKIDARAKTVTVRTPGIALESCAATLPVPDGEFTYGWTKHNGRTKTFFKAPAGWKLVKKENGKDAHGGTFPDCPAIGPTVAWDFTRGVPESVRPRTFARVPQGEGLVSVAAGDLMRASGVQLKRKFVFPEAFLFEAEFVPPKDAVDGVESGILFDDMYVNYLPKRKDRGLQVMLTRRGTDWTPVVYAGFGNTTCSVAGPTCTLAPGKPAKFAFLFDANRRLVWRFGEKTSEMTFIARAGGFAPSSFPTIIGDRYGSNYSPFKGTIRRVAITPVARPKIAFAARGRQAFVRGEEGAILEGDLENHSNAALEQVTVTACQFTSSGRLVNRLTTSLGAIPAGEKRSVSLPVETRLGEKKTDLRVEISYRGGKIERQLSVLLGPAPARRMPALMWGFSAPVSVLADLGFTHGLDYGLGFSRILPEGNDPTLVLRKLDSSLAVGVSLAKSAGVVLPDGAEPEQFYRRTRTGLAGFKANSKPQFEVGQPVLLKLAKDLAATNAAAFGAHPAFGGVLPCSELRDHTFPSFNTEHLRYKAETGRDVPPEVNGTRFDLKAATVRFPKGVVPVDDPILAYYRWFWRDGDGWPRYTGAVAAGYREGGVHKDFFSFWDPSVRCPPCWGSGGAVDYLNQWIYAVPEPMNVAGPLEEMFAMAAGRPGQQVMMMTQLICYRAQIAPSNVVVKPVPQWVTKRPRAGFPSIPPDSLQEATWSMIAKPVKGIMYHGWGTIFETGSETGYCFTNPETTERLRELLTGVVARLGPMLLDLGRAESPVAILESATTCFMGGPASWGWSAPAVTFLQRARLDPRVVYEETILRDGLEGVKVLYAPQCRFLTPDVIAKIQAFQQKGGILVGDAETLAALTPNLRAPLVSFRPPPASDQTEDIEAMEAAKSGDGKRRAGTVRMKRTMLSQADDLRAALAPHYRPATDSSSGEIVTYNRRWQDVDYVFAINDKRTFGDYVGPWGMTMEKGLPFAGEVTHADPARRVKAVYELSRGGEVAFTRSTDGTVKVPVSYETNDGRLFLFSPQKIASLAVNAPKTVACGAAFEVELRVLDEAGKPVAALLPVDVRVTTAEGRALDGVGYASAPGGVCRLRVQTNIDDAPGAYRLVCRELASGCTQTVTVMGRQK
ncbi:MAG: hypothetical protein MJ249_10940 [Kiritimatiellae bacterium]|nr:hypothetical protein [Kiritimatiellia bacterium]